VALVVASGCGSSNSSNSNSTPATAATTTRASGGTTAPATGSASAQSATTKVAYRNLAINPATITVKVGTSVTWTSFDSGGVQHNVSVQSGPVTFTSPTLKTGNDYVFKFTKAGVYSYICTFHPTIMIGKVTVVP
jgi:plastocyanin